MTIFYTGAATMRTSLLDMAWRPAIVMHKGKPLMAGGPGHYALMPPRKATATQKPKEGGHFLAHAGKRQ